MTQELVLDNKMESEKNTARLLYIVHALTFFFSLGVLSVVPLVINYSKRPDTEGTLVYSHHTWMIRSFWWYVFWMVLGGVLFATFILIPVAWVIWGVAWLWKAYRLIRGFIAINANEAVSA
jgi:uncharacterized membrane protein